MIRALHDRTVLFRIRGLVFATYGVPVGLAFIAGFGVAMWYADMAGLPAPTIAPVFLLGILPGALIGARLFSIFSDVRSLLRSPMRAIFNPGFFVHGGVLGGGLAIVVWCWATGDPLLVFLDAGGFSMPVAEAVCRVGCHVYGCCWGRPTRGPLGLRYTSADAKVVRCRPHLRGVALHPVQLYTSAAMLAVFVLFWVIAPCSPFDGFFAGAYLLLHGAVRLVLERFRDDDRGRVFGSLTQTQMYSMLWIAAGVTLLVVASVIDTRSPFDRSVRFWDVIMHPGVGPWLAACAVCAAAVFGLHNGRVGRWLP